MISDANFQTPKRGGRAGAMAALTAALLLGACSQTSELLAPIGLAENPAAAAQDAGEGGGTELQKATLYWGKEFSNQPAKLDNALNYARNLKALGEKQKALAVLQQASVFHDGNPELAGEYGRLALELNQVGLANRLLSVADNPAKPDWKVISARGTVSAKQGDYKNAIAYYERALTLSSNQPSVINNLAMAHAMSGNATKAEELLRQASTSQDAPQKVQQNLALVLGLQGRYDEANTSVASVSGTAAHMADTKADTALLRSVVKVQPRPAPAAIPAFTTTLAGAPAAQDGPALRPAVVDAATAAQPWRTSVAANVTTVPAAVTAAQSPAGR